MRDEALAVATRALARREHSTRGLRERLLRAGVAGSEADEVLEELQRVGLLDDGRFARERARALAELDPERERAERLVERRGASAATARLLAGRGFDEAVVEALVAQER